MKNLKNTNKGITLIALVITIIVMLILVAVTITMVIKGGLFEYAGEAAASTNNAISDEKQLGNGGLSTEGTHYNSIDEYLEKREESEEKEDTEEKEETIVGNNGETFSEIYTETKLYTDENGDTATIPAGFSVGTSKEINLIDTGLVIRDINGNEFIWIPVTKDLSKSYDYSALFGEPKELTSTWSRSSLETKPKYDSQEILDELYGAKYYTYSEDFKYAEEYSEMVEKVNQYDGFYIGKYNTPILTSGKALFTKDSKNYSYLWYGLYQVQKDINIVGNGTSVQTAMIYGVLWDKTMQFIRDQKTAGNTTYDVDTGTDNWHKGTSVTNSGQANSEDVALNIWDLESNATEWIQECYSTNARVLRGGYYNTKSSAASRGTGDPTRGLGMNGSRCALYIK